MGGGLPRVFALGASGVQMGKAFLGCPEANITHYHRQVLRQALDDDTRLTRAFSGRGARAKNNRYIEEMAMTRLRFRDYPSMYAFSDPIDQTSQKLGIPDFQFLLYGQAAALNREMPAKHLVAILAKEVQEAMTRSQLLDRPVTPERPTIKNDCNIVVLGEEKTRASQSCPRFSSFEPRRIRDQRL